MNALLAVGCVFLVMCIWEGIYVLERQRSTQRKIRLYKAMRVNWAIRRGLS